MSFLVNTMAFFTKLYWRLTRKYERKFDDLHPRGETPLITNSGRVYWDEEFLKKECETCRGLISFHNTTCSKGCPCVFVKSKDSSNGIARMIRCEHMSKKVETFFNQTEFDNHRRASEQRLSDYSSGRTVPVATSHYDGWEDYYGHISEYEDVITTRSKPKSTTECIATSNPSSSEIGMYIPKPMSIGLSKNVSKNTHYEWLAELAKPKSIGVSKLRGDHDEYL